MMLLFKNNETGEVFVKSYATCGGCPHCSPANKETPEKYQRFYNRVFGKGKYTFYYGEKYLPY